MIATVCEVLASNIMNLLFDLQSSHEKTAEDKLSDESAFITLVEKINDVFTTVQDRQKKLLSMLLTVEIIKACDEDLDKAKDLGFNIIPNWSATNFNPKNLQGSIDYVFEYMSDEEVHCKGVVFKFNNIENEGCIIYRRNTSDEEL